MTTAEKIVKGKTQTLDEIINSKIKDYSLKAVWLKDEAEFKDHLFKLNSEIASLCGKKATSVSIKDLAQLLNNLDEKISKLGAGKLRISHVEALMKMYKSASTYIDVVSYTYAVAMAMHGNPWPVIRKAGFKAGANGLNKVNAKYVASTYVIGLLSKDLYGHDVDLTEERIVEEQETDTIEEFDPIFRLLNEEQIKDLAKLLKLKVDVNLPIQDARQKIVNELNYHGNNKIKYLYKSTVGDNDWKYISLLTSVCADLKIELDTENELEVKNLEEKIVMRVLQNTIEKLSDEEKAKLEEKLKNIDDPRINKELLASSGALATILGLNATGFGVYLAASSALGALTNGLGISLAFSTYTTMSTALSAILGPVGIGVAALGVLGSLSIAEPKKTIPAIIYIAMLRQQLELKEFSESRKTIPYLKITLLTSTIIILAYFLWINFL